MAEHMDVLFNQRVNEGDSEFLYQVQIYHFQLHMKIADCSRCPPLTKLIEQTHVLVFNWVWDLGRGAPDAASAFPPRAD